MTLRTLNYGNYGIFLLMGNAGFCPSTVLGSLGSGLRVPLHKRMARSVRFFPNGTSVNSSSSSGSKGGAGAGLRTLN